MARRTGFTIAFFALLLQDVAGFGVHHLSSTQRRCTSTSTIARHESEPAASGYDKAAELRSKAEAAKAKAKELKKVAEQKAAAAMEAVKNQNDRKAEEEAAAVLKVQAEVTEMKTEETVAPKASTSFNVDASAGAIIPLNKENVEFTSGVLGGVAAVALGANPLFAVVVAAAANYISRKEDLGEISEIVNSISTSSLQTLNWFGKLDEKYTVLDKLSETLDQQVSSLKSSEGKNAETVGKIEQTIKSTSNQLSQLAEELDLVEGSKQALGAFGDVLETSIDKAVDANKEYKLTERAGEAAKKAIEKVKDRE